MWRMRAACKNQQFECQTASARAVRMRVKRRQHSALGEKQTRLFMYVCIICIHICTYTLENAVAVVNTSKCARSIQLSMSTCCRFMFCCFVLPALTLLITAVAQMHAHIFSAKSIAATTIIILFLLLLLAHSCVIYDDILRHHADAINSRCCRLLAYLFVVICVVVSK